jgi:L-ascorbate metabolism protein UlaG (beta-lactamase superfamily)
MELFAELYSPLDLFLSPIGSYFTMDIHQAALATKLLKPRNVIPMHYDTFPVVQANPEKFKALVSERSPDTKVIIIKPGESTEI